MIKNLPFRNTTIRFEVEGEGKPIVLLHGFMESLAVWDELSEELSKEFQVIKIDLLGHGKSGIVGGLHTMDIMAEEVKVVLDYLELDKVMMVGHSMGGYVSLQFLKDYPQRLSCLVLLHSTPLADSEERKRVRDEMIKQIKVGLKVKLSKEHVQKTFSEHNLDKMVKKVGFMKIVAMNTSNEGIISALEGMKLRPDYREVLAKAKIPVLIILGKHDKFISLDVLEQIQLPKESEVLILENSGHQGYIEEKDKVLEKIREFGKKCRY